MQRQVAQAQWQNQLQKIQQQYQAQLAQIRGRQTALAQTEEAFRLFLLNQDKLAPQVAQTVETALGQARHRAGNPALKFTPEETQRQELATLLMLNWANPAKRETLLGTLKELAFVDTRLRPDLEPNHAASQPSGMPSVPQGPLPYPTQPLGDPRQRQPGGGQAAAPPTINNQPARRDPTLDALSPQVLEQSSQAALARTPRPAQRPAGPPSAQQPAPATAAQQPVVRLHPKVGHNIYGVVMAQPQINRLSSIVRSQEQTELTQIPPGIKQALEQLISTQGITITANSDNYGNHNEATGAAQGTVSFNQERWTLKQGYQNRSTDIGKGMIKDVQIRKSDGSQTTGQIHFMMDQERNTPGHINLISVKFVPGNTQMDAGTFKR
jgi:hypothetical protein